MEKRVKQRSWWVIVCLVCGFYCVASAQTSEYEKRILEDRKTKDKDFRKGKESPIPKKERGDFTGLVYFPVDSMYRVQARLVKDTLQRTFEMKTSTTRLPVYRVYGKLVFKLKGEDCVLTVYQSMDLLRNPVYKDYLFVPFTDLTTDESSYGAGRYIDMRISDNEIVWIDFNTAYNPYCAYSDQYSCPITPAENKLPVRVEAGEKIYKEH